MVGHFVYLADNKPLAFDGHQDAWGSIFIIGLK